jgi:hypothetical protein
MAAGEPPHGQGESVDAGDGTLLRYRRRPDVLWRRGVHRILALAVDGQAITELTGTGVALWDALEDAATEAELAIVLATQFEADLASVTRDLGAALEDLVDRDLVEVIHG